MGGGASGGVPSEDGDSFRGSSAPSGAGRGGEPAGPQQPRPVCRFGGRWRCGGLRRRHPVLILLTTRLALDRGCSRRGWSRVEPQRSSGALPLRPAASYQDLRLPDERVRLQPHGGRARGPGGPRPRPTTPHEADVLLINTCSVREKAQEKVFSLLGAWRELKQARPGVMIGVGGCVASQEGEAHRSRARPLSTWCSVPRPCTGCPRCIDAGPRPRQAGGGRELPRDREIRSPARAARRGRHAPSFPIMEGCSKYCSFCVVPYTRGEEISRPVDGVLPRSARSRHRACARSRCSARTSTPIAARRPMAT